MSPRELRSAGRGIRPRGTTPVLLAVVVLTVTALALGSLGPGVADGRGSSGIRGGKSSGGVKDRFAYHAVNDVINASIGELSGGSTWYDDWFYTYAPSTIGSPVWSQEYSLWYGSTIHRSMMANGTSDFTVEDYFGNGTNDPDNFARTRSGNFTVGMTVTIDGRPRNPGDASFVRIAYNVTNTGTNAEADVRFFALVDYDIPATTDGNFTDDVSAYAPIADMVWVRDPVFDGGFSADEWNRNSSRHGTDVYDLELWDDDSDGNLNDNDTYGPGDPGVGEQWNAGTMDPGASWGVTVEFWFNRDPVVADAGGPYAGTTGTPIAFDASASTGTGLLQYRWSFDGGGTWGPWSWRPTATNTWSSEYSGLVCVQARDDVESSQDCATVLVGPGRPDYQPSNAQPIAPTVGLSLPLALSIDVWNGAPTAAPLPATVAFYNESTPGAPFATFPVPPLGPWEESAPFQATWISPATPGVYRVVGDVDYANDIGEANESNNRYTWTIHVVPGPVTSLVVGAPNYTAAQTYVASATLLSFAVLDQSGAGIRDTSYRIDGGPWVNYTATGPFRLPCEGSHTVEWRSEDFAGNVEPVASAVIVVDCTPPATTIAPSVGPWRWDTAFALSATDAASGVARTEYWIDTLPWAPYAGTFLVPVGAHVIGYRSVDRVDNAEAEKTLAVTIAAPPGPVTTLVVGTPRYASAETYVTSATTLSFAILDRSGMGIRNTTVRVDGGPWVNYTATGPFHLAADGPHRVEWRSEDLAGNVEPVANATLVLDDTPPTTTLSPATGPYTAATTFTLSATDAGSGVNATEYRIDNGSWTPYAAGFTLAAGDHTIAYRSVDHLGNQEPDRTRAVHVEALPPPSAANLKPLVAAVFAAVLASLGAWASKRRPWRGAAGARGALKAFTATSLPFVIAEVTTGVVSLLTGLLAIPPLIGVGTAFDVTILAVGAAVAISRIRGMTTRTTKDGPGGAAPPGEE